MFGRYDDGVLPARQGFLGADDLVGGVTHSRDGEEAVKELEGRPGGREHGQAAGQGVAGRSGAEAPLPEEFFKGLICKSGLITSKGQEFLSGRQTEG